MFHKMNCIICQLKCIKFSTSENREIKMQQCFTVYYTPKNGWIMDDLLLHVPPSDDKILECLDVPLMANTAECVRTMHT